MPKSSKLRCEATLRQLWEKSDYFRPSPDRSNSLNLRLRRSLSWLGRAEDELESEDWDAAFIFYWIAFNAAYGQRGSSGTDQEKERSLIADYFRKIVVCDSHAVRRAIWPDLVPQINLLLNNKYVFEPFWKHHNEELGFQDWERKHESILNQMKWALKEAAKAPVSGLPCWQTERILRELFARLYTLRNQLLHGGATWRGSVNRDQVRTGAKLTAVLMPCFIKVMIEHPEADWGVPRYPPVV